MRCGVYIHIPFCSRKCSYCAFHSVAGAGPVEQDAIVNKILLDAAVCAAEIRATARTVYVGGGTPSTLSAGLLTRLIGGIRSVFSNDIAVLEEITCEANPESATAGFMAEAVGAGVTRLSVGVQSLSADLCTVIGRRPTTPHRLEEIRAAWPGALSGDLITGIPGQSTADVVSDVRRLAGMGFTHISIYDLAVEAGTELSRRVRSGAVSIPGTGPDWGKVCETLLSLGYARYEVSNFAVPGHESLHNTGYWRMQPYIGLGPSAASTFPYHGETVRLEQPRDHQAFLGSHPIRDAARETLGQHELVTEFFMLGLRTAEGIRADRFRQLSGRDLEVVLGPRIDSLERQGLLVRVDERGETEWSLRPTNRGMDLLDRVLGELLGDSASSQGRNLPADCPKT